MDKKYNGFNNGRDRSDGVGGREVNHGKQETMTKEIKELVLNEYKNGNIVVAGIEGLQTMPIKEFIKQDAEFMFYDLNRSEAVVLTFINDPKWVNDYAVCKVIRELKQQLSAERERAGKLVEAVQSFVQASDDFNIGYINRNGEITRCGIAALSVAFNAAEKRLRIALTESNKP
jgi:hypothetical protein